VLRDVGGIFLALMAALVNMASDDELSFYADPGLAVLSVTLLLALSYPFALECASILLQTIPGHVDLDRLPEKIQRAFPGVENIHHLHVWSLRPGKVVATGHLLFASPNEYLAAKDRLQEMFREEGVSLVTLQPEFKQMCPTNNGKCCCTDHQFDGNHNECDDDGTVEAKHSHHDGHGHSHGDGHGHSHGDGHGHSHKDGHSHSQKDSHGHSHEDGHSQKKSDGHRHSGEQRRKSGADDGETSHGHNHNGDGLNGHSQNCQGIAN